MRLSRKKALVVGLGNTGLALAKFLIAKGARVAISDKKPASALKGQIRRLKDIDFKLQCGGHYLKTFLGADLIVLSPGVPPSLTPIEIARTSGIPVLSELDLASHFLKTPIIAITGTNGKTTTTTLIGKVLKANGFRVWVGGNLGKSIIDAASLDNLDYIVAEVSSFQLEITKKFHPYIGLLLNVSKDHLDRHGNLSQYLHCKSRLFGVQTENDWAILDNDNPDIASIPTLGRKVFFSDKKELSPGAYLRDGHIFACLNSLRWQLNIESLKLLGKHNYKNIMAALLVAQIIGCGFNATEKTIYNFKGLPHRLEWIKAINGINFYNDSKGTNVGATIAALESLNPPIVLIAGGLSKGQKFEPLREIVRKKVKATILVGEAKETIAQALDGATFIIKVSSLKEAVLKAMDWAENRGNVLFSPACASFDMFRDYKERGLIFKKIVNEFDKLRMTNDKAQMPNQAQKSRSLKF